MDSTFLTNILNSSKSLILLKNKRKIYIWITLLNLESPSIIDKICFKSKFGLYIFFS